MRMTPEDIENAIVATYRLTRRLVEAADRLSASDRDYSLERAGEAFENLGRYMGREPVAPVTVEPDPAAECTCFGDSGSHASTYVPVGSDLEHCDLCGKPVPLGSTDVLNAPVKVERVEVANV